MSRIIKRGIVKTQNRSVLTGKVDHSQFSATIDRYRSLGTRIGKKVRLRGRIDGVNPGSVVTKDNPENGIAAGNPSKVLRPIGQEEKDHLIETMENDQLFGRDEH